MMQRAVMHGPGDMRLEDGPQPAPGPGGVVIEVGRCGICGTDRSIFAGDYPIELPLVLGHELSGTVVEVGPSVHALAVGDRITVDPNVTCGACAYCQRGLTNLCERLTPVGITRPGGFASYTTVPETNAYRLGDEVSLVAGAMIEPLACCVRGIQVSDVQLGDTVMLIGAGPMACMMVQLVRLRGASRIIVAEPVAAPMSCSSVRARPALRLRRLKWCAEAEPSCGSVSRRRDRTWR
jgi:threonine dehydrogenase-like Zn-dependent dehydrogenase